MTAFNIAACRLRNIPGKLTISDYEMMYGYEMVSPCPSSLDV